MIDQNTELIIQSAIDHLLERDAMLFQNDVAERAITHRLANYLQEQFAEWDVDCEYNRNLNDVKRLKEICNPTNNENGASVFPDIIIHKRMTDNNFIVIEVKKTTNTTPDDCDMQKLEAFRNELGYKHGLFIRFKAGTKDVGVAKMEWAY
jgi:hypothetical protein